MSYVLIVILLVKQNILLLFKRNPPFDKNKAYVKKSFGLFLLYLDNRYFSFLEVLYERSHIAFNLTLAKSLGKTVKEFKFIF